MRVELTADELRLIVQALKNEASRWVAEWARAGDDVPPDSAALLWAEADKRQELAQRLETEGAGQ